MQLLQRRGTERSKIRDAVGSCPSPPALPGIAVLWLTQPRNGAAQARNSPAKWPRSIPTIHSKDHTLQPKLLWSLLWLLQIEVPHHTNRPCFRKITNWGGIYQTVPPSSLGFFCPSHNCTFLTQWQSTSGDKGRHHHRTLNWTGWAFFSPNPCNNGNTRDLNSEQRRTHLSDRIEEIKAFLPLIEWPQYHIPSAPAATAGVIEPRHRGLAEGGRGQILPPEF